MISCSKARALLEQAFVLKDAALLDKIHPHLADCAECQQTYQRLFEAEALLAPPSEQDQLLSATEKELLLGRVLPPASKPRSAQQHPTRWRALILVGAAAALLLLVGIPLGAQLLSPPSAELDTFTARGSKVAGQAAPVGLRAFCMATTAAGIEVRSVSTNPCSRHDTLGFAYRNTSDQRWHLRVVLVDADQRQHLVFPRAPRAAATVAPADDEVPLDATLAGELLQPGRATVFGAFSQRPLSAELMQALITTGDGQAAAGTAGKVQLVRLELSIGQ